MGNDNKIAKKNGVATEKELMLFLGDELEPLRKTKRVNVYDLETEYAKTRKNKLWSVYITIGLTLVAVVLVTIFTVRGLSASNEKINVNLSSFEGLNLANIFDQLQRTQEKFDEATKRRAELQGTLEARLSRAKLKMESDLELLQSTRLSKKALSERRQKIQSDYNAEVAAAHDALDARLSAAEAEVHQYDEQLKAYDSNNVAKAREWEQQMDSERQVHQLEKKKIIDSYEAQLEEAKRTLEETRQRDFEDRRAATAEITMRYEAEIATYDPVFKDLKTSGVVSSANQMPSGTFDASKIMAEAGNISESFTAALEDAQHSYNDLEYLYGKSASIPQRNSMRGVVSGQRKLSYNITNDLATACANEIKTKNAQVEAAKNQVAAMQEKVDAAAKQVNSANEQKEIAQASGQAYVAILNSGLVDDKTAGFVLDPANKRGISIFIRDSHISTVTRDGTTKVDLYSGRTKYSSGVIMYAENNYFISLNDDNDRQKVTVGDTFRIVKK